MQIFLNNLSASIIAQNLSALLLNERAIYLSIKDVYSIIFNGPRQYKLLPTKCNVL